MAKKSSRRNAKSQRQKRTQKRKPLKIAALIISAINGLNEMKGTTPSKIVGYLSYGSNVPEEKIRQQVHSTLKRGLRFGILRRYRGRYFLPMGDEERAHKLAQKFSRLRNSERPKADEEAKKVATGVKGSILSLQKSKTKRHLAREQSALGPRIQRRRGPRGYLGSSPRRSYSEGPTIRLKQSNLGARHTKEIK